MRIALVLDDTLDRPDGVQQYVLTLGVWLSGRGHSVHYLVADTARDEVPNLHSLGRYFSTTFNGNGVRTPLPASRARIREVLNSVQPEVVHVQMPYSPFLTGRIISNMQPSVALVGTFHILPLGRIQKLSNRVLEMTLRGTLSRFSEVMAVSDPAAAFAREVYGLTPEVVPNLVDVGKFQEARRERPRDVFTVVFLGRMVKRKGVLQLVRAWQMVPVGARVNARLVIGGRGPLIKKARRLAGQDTSISFQGFVSEEDKPGFLAAADVACFPSTGGESFGIILVEAMAAGAGVVIGGDNPGYAAVLVPESLVDSNDVAGFAKRLQDLISDAALRGRLHEQQKQLAPRYDVNRVGPRIEAVYRRAIARSGN